MGALSQTPSPLGGSWAGQVPARRSRQRRPTADREDGRSAGVRGLVFRTGAPSVFRTATFEELYHQHVHAVFRFAVSVSGRRDLAEDLTSEAFLALYRHLDGIDCTQLPGWLLTVVRNRARDWWRRRMVEQRHADEVAERPVAPAPPLEGRILECRDLKPVHRKCLVLHYVHGMTRAEIAGQTGLKETQVKGHLQYALTLLRKAHGVGLPAQRDKSQ